jgi:hypothetical protein
MCLRAVGLSIVALISFSAEAKKPPSEMATAVTKPPNPDDEYRVRGEALARARFKDPDAVKFTGEVVMHDSDGHPSALCGFANGKNEFGGYTGRSLFGVVVDTKKAYMMRGPNNIEEAKDYVIVCKGYKEPEAP